MLNVGAASAANVINPTAQRMSSFDAFQPDQVVMQFNEKGDQAMMHCVDLAVVGGGASDQPVLMAFDSVVSRDATIAMTNHKLHSNARWQPVRRCNAPNRRRFGPPKRWADRGASAEPNYWQRAYPR